MSDRVELVVADGVAEPQGLLASANHRGALQAQAQKRAPVYRD